MAIKTCEARQYSDQMVCNRCGLCWDVNDPEPPSCLTGEDMDKRHGREVLKELKIKLNTPPAAT